MRPFVLDERSAGRAEDSAMFTAVERTAPCSAYGVAGRSTGGRRQALLGIDSEVEPTTVEISGHVRYSVSYHSTGPAVDYTTVVTWSINA